MASGKHIATQPRGRNGQLVKSADTAAKHQAMIDARVAGDSYAKIAEDFGYTNEGSAYRAIWDALNKRTDASVEQMRAVEGERLRGMMAIQQQTIECPGPLASAGKIVDEIDRDVRTRAVVAYAKLSEQYSRLFGMNVPVVSIRETKSSREMEQRFTQFAEESLPVMMYRAQLEALAVGHVTVRLPDGVPIPEIAARTLAADAYDDDDQGDDDTSA
jgi:hypothetical protein